MSELQRLEKPYKRIMIVGGGNVGAGPAAAGKDYNVKLIERNQQRAAELAEQLHDTIVFYGDASDRAAGRRARRASGCLHRYHQRR